MLREATHISPYSTIMAQMCAGLQAARLPGDLPQLISIVGVHLAIAQAVCTLCGANAKLSGRLDKLSGVVLHGWYILADESDGHAQNRAATDTIQSPLQGLSEDQQQEYIPDLLHATFTVLGLLRTQSASDDEDSLVDTRIAADWLFKGIKALSTSVSSLLRCSVLAVRNNSSVNGKRECCAVANCDPCFSC